ncbi:MAG: ATP-binding cassette domain-containing protein [Chloroflexi bacterium]|nr:ATP-binding cassette domain-containing protein [Chloroflexota bacterium]
MHIELRNITKRFGSLVANDAISLTLDSGQIVGVLGENGAGKSTLMKIVSGYQPADSGQIWLDGRRAPYSTPHGAIAAGIGMLHQDPLDVAAFTVIEDFALGFGGALDYAAARTQLGEVCGQLGFSLPPDAEIASLSIAQRQQLEMARLLALGVRTLILDEPTTGISAEQKDALFAALRKLAKQGVTILLVSHKLEDVLQLCDRAVVLRRGQLTGDVMLPVPHSELVTLMFGQAQPPLERRTTRRTSDRPALTLHDLTIVDHRLHIERFSLTVAPGEVIGVAGLDGSGQAPIMRAAVGLQPVVHGEITVGSQPLTGRSYRAFLAAGAAFGAAGRLEEGLVPGLSLTEHFALIDENSARIRWGRVRSRAQSQIDHYQIKGLPDSRIDSLSGGNQQRVLMAMLPERPTIMVLEQPTRGLDVESARWIWRQLLDRCEAGAGLIFSSDDLDEILNYSDRIVVCFAGRTSILDNTPELTTDDLGALIGGATA